MMKATTFEELLVFHCAPTLSGIKAASLMACSGEMAKAAPHTLARCNRQAGHKGIRFTLLCRLPQRSLVLVYRPAQLAAIVEQPGAKKLLEQAGYPVGKGLCTLLAHLGRRLKESPEFPHEIGLFLGYPLADVEGFIKHKGQNFKCCGYWKVYTNEQQANIIFHQYTQCRNTLYRRLGMGISLPMLISAA